jgi:hypothetical protein
MSNTATAKKTGGEYGDVRANIDVDRLNAYLAKHVPAVKTPVDVKQFKVRYYVLVSNSFKCLRP